MLDVQDVRIARGDRTVVSDVSFAASTGEALVLMGASGSGKTTVLRAIAGLDAIAAGRIGVDGLAIGPAGVPRGHDRREWYQRVGMVFQFHHLFEHLTALQNVCLAPVHVAKVSKDQAEHRAMELLEQLGVAPRANALPRELSGGEAQRVAIARALAMGPRVLLMDEPTASLDPARRGDLAAILRQLAATGCTLVMASHDEDFVQACAHRVLTMEAGRIVHTR